MGEGRAGKTALVRALRNLPFKHTDSTAGVSTSTLDTTDMHDWKEMDGTAYEQVPQCIQVYSHADGDIDIALLLMQDWL